VLHACCHNPTGYDITPAQWDQVVAAVKARKLVPFLDMAYQGFGQGIAEDGAVIAEVRGCRPDFFVSTSFSKSFSLYGERVGALSVLCESKEEAARVLSQLKIVIRTNYSNPPIHGGAGGGHGAEHARSCAPNGSRNWPACACASRPCARRWWTAEGRRRQAGHELHHQQIGMFSYSGLSKDQMVRLRNEFGVYGTDTGRICVAALNSKNIDYVCASIAKVI
jgi:aromatic-amino-acid transaminase